MRVGYIVALLMIVLIVGCAAPETPATPEAPAEEIPVAPAAPPEAPEAPAAPPAPAAPEIPAVVKGDIIVTSAGFDPAEMTVKVGSTLAIKSTEGRHKLTIDGKTTPVIEEGSAADVTFDEVGKIRIFDIFTKKSAYVTVTEESAEEATE